MLPVLLLAGDVGAWLSQRESLRMSWRAHGWSETVGSYLTVVQSEISSGGCASIRSSSFGLLGRVLHVFLFLADFITKERTVRSGFAFTPPLLESMNINLVGRLDCLLGAGRPLMSLPSCLSCAIIWFWCHPAIKALWICNCKDCTLKERKEPVSQL